MEIDTHKKYNKIEKKNSIKKEKKIPRRQQKNETKRTPHTQTTNEEPANSERRNHRGTRKPSHYKPDTITLRPRARNKALTPSHTARRRRRRVGDAG